MVKILAVVGIIMGILSALPYLPGAIGSYFQHFQNPTSGKLVTSVKYTVALFVAFAVPTTLLGIFIAVVTG